MIALRKLSVPFHEGRVSGVMPTLIVACAAKRFLEPNKHPVSGATAERNRRRVIVSTVEAFSTVEASPQL